MNEVNKKLTEELFIAITPVLVAITLGLIGIAIIMGCKRKMKNLVGCLWLFISIIILIFELFSI